MPSFRYKAVAVSGRIEAGVIDAADRFAAISDLQARGYLPIAAAEAIASPPSRLALPKFSRTAVTARQLGLLLQELSVLLQAGLPLDRALDLLTTEAATPRLRPVLTGIVTQVRHGLTLAEAVAQYPAIFSPSIATLIEAGEAGGTLDFSLNRAADMLLSGAALRESIFGALLYPIILMVVASLSLTIILVVVIPEFKPLFEDAGARLPVPTQIVMAFGDLVGALWLPVLVLTFLAAAIIGRALKRPPVRLAVDRRILRLPLLGALLTKVEIVRFARTLGTLADNGIPLPTALSITCRGFSNFALAGAVEQVGASLKEGEGLAMPLEATRLFPRTALHLIRVGEETARLGDMLARLAEILEREVERDVRRALAIFVPLVTVGMGVIIAGIIASILVAVLSLNDLAI